MKKIFLTSLFFYLAALYPTALTLSGKDKSNTMPPEFALESSMRAVKPPEAKNPLIEDEEYFLQTNLQSAVENSPTPEVDAAIPSLDSTFSAKGENDDLAASCKDFPEDLSFVLNPELSERFAYLRSERITEKQEKGFLTIPIRAASSRPRLETRSRDSRPKPKTNYMPYLGQTLVTKDDGCYKVNPIFHRLHLATLHLINRGYCATRKDKQGKLIHPELLEEADETIDKLQWHISPPIAGLSGVNKYTGNNLLFDALFSTTALDFGVFMATHKSTSSKFPHVIIIVIRGSEGPKTGPSWITNFAATKQTFFFGIDRLCLHNGYYRRFETYRPGLAAELKRQTESLAFSKEDLEKTIIVVTGHSQGGGVASIVYYWMVTEGAKSILGINQPNRIWLYALSPARCCGNQETADVFHANCGKDNMISHGVTHDLVMAVPLGAKTTKALRIFFVPYSIAALLDHPLGYFVTLGTRAYDSAKAIYRRYLKFYPKSMPFAKKKCSKFIAKNSTATTTEKELKELYRQFYAPYTESLGRSLEDFWKWHLYYKIKGRAVPITFAIIFSHYGSNWIDGGCYFDPKIPKRKLGLEYSITRGERWVE